MGCTAMLIAGKYEEIYPPNIRDWRHISDKAYTVKQIVAMEQSILNTIGFEVYGPTQHTFLLEFMNIGESKNVLVTDTALVRTSRERTKGLFKVAELFCDASSFKLEMLKVLTPQPSANN